MCVKPFDAGVDQRYLFPTCLPVRRTGRRFSVTVDVTAVLLQCLISCNFHIRPVIFELYKLGLVRNTFYEVHTTFSSNLGVLVPGCYAMFLLSSRYSLQERLAAYETLVPCDQKTAFTGHRLQPVTVYGFHATFGKTDLAC